MKSKNIITLLAVSAAVGAAYYLLNTDKGKEKLKDAEKGIKDLTKSIKKISKKSAKKLSSLTKSCANAIDSVK